MKTIISIITLFCSGALLQAQDNYWREQNLKRDADANARQRQKDIDATNKPNSPSSTGSWDKFGSNVNNFLKEKQQADAQKKEERERAEKEAREAQKLRTAEAMKYFELHDKELAKSPYYTVKYSDGSVYEGQMFGGVGKGKSEKRNGNGRLTFSNGEYFEGTFYDDQLGSGVYYYPNGDKWNVSYSLDRTEAKGSYLYKDGSSYHGNFVLDNTTKKFKRTGKGSLWLKDWTKIESYFDGENMINYAVIKYNSEIEGAKRGDIYEGQVKYNVKHGRGKYTHSNGKVDDGYWVNGAYVGENPPQGEPKRIIVDELKEGLMDAGFYMAEINESDGKFVGRMFDNKRNGKGIIKYHNGNKLEGEWRNDELVKGVLKREDDSRIYDGGFKDGLYHYYGGLYDKKGRNIIKNGYWVAGKFVDKQEKFENLTGIIHSHTIIEGTTYYNYTGEATVDKVPHGKGRKYKSDESYSYEGDFVNGKAHGKGLETYADSQIYKGDFVNGRRHGKGKIIWKSGNIYDGDWIENTLSGKGIYTWANGDVYEGDSVNNDRTGYGKYTWRNGDVYEGQFVKGQMDGKGKKTYKDGRVENGTWQNDRFMGK